MSELGTLTICLWLVINGRDSKKSLLVRGHITYDEAKELATEFIRANNEMLKLQHLVVQWQANPQTVYLPEVFEPQIVSVKRIARKTEAE